MVEGSENNPFSRTAKIFYKIGHDRVRMMKMMTCYDSYCGNENCFHLMASVLSNFKWNI